MRQRSKRRDAQAIAHHYDVSNDFYALFLDPLMLYTCAYYREPDGKLEQAQEDKVDLVCRKLRLKPGETLLDIGCGWGGLSIWAAQHYGVKAHGVTLSRAQAEWAAARIKREGLAETCLVEYRDHRDLPPGARYDKIAAIGIRLKRWVSLHGASLNVDPDLTHFSGIVPCGVADARYGVTSLADLGLPVAMAEVDMALRREFEPLFGPTARAARQTVGSTANLSP